MAYAMRYGPVPGIGVVLIACQGVPAGTGVDGSSPSETRQDARQ